VAGRFELKYVVDTRVQLALGQVMRTRMLKGEFAMEDGT
jgi:hypothetical protein